jgi:hypothetical protein
MKRTHNRDISCMSVQLQLNALVILFKHLAVQYIGTRRKMASWGSSVGIVTRLRAGRPGFDSRNGMEFSYSSIHPDWFCGPPLLLSDGYKWLFLRRWLGREADHSPPSSAEAKNSWSYTSTPRICLHGVVLN